MTDPRVDLKGEMLRLSKEQMYLKLTNKCPLCHKFTMPQYTEPGGEPMSTATAIMRLKVLDQQTRVTCGRCGQSWNFTSAGQPSSAVSDELVVRITETVRTEEPIGDEMRRVDNSGTSTSTVRRLRLTKRWLQRCEVQVEQSHATTGGAELAVGTVAKYHSTTEAAVRRNLTIGTEDEQTFEEEIEIAVPPRTLVQLHLRWKRIWQEGYADLTDPQGNTARVSFRTVVGVTFDQESVDS
jgi:transcription elongation factor Elf1